MIFLVPEKVVPLHMRRLNKTDWALIKEALQMLEEDYPDGHPQQELVEDLLRLAEAKQDAERAPRLRVPSVPRHIKEAIMRQVRRK